MEKRSGFTEMRVAVIVTALLLFVGFITNRSGLVQIALGGSSTTSTVIVTSVAPSVTSVNINSTNPATITLTTNATTSITVGVTISDNNGCSEIAGATSTILLYRSG